MDSTLLGIAVGTGTSLAIGSLTKEGIEKTQREIDECDALLLELAERIAEERGITVEEALEGFKTPPGPVEQWFLDARRRVMEFIQRHLLNPLS